VVDSKNTCNLNSISWLQRINQVILEENLDRSWKLASWGIFWHLLDRHHLGVLVDAVSILSCEWVIILILDRESIVSFSRGENSSLGNLSQVEFVVVLLDLSLFCSLAVMDGSLDFGLHHRHSRHDTLDLHELVHKIGFETSWSHVIFSKVSFEVDVINFNFFRELGI
jgi:hypothetical protein